MLSRVATIRIVMDNLSTHSVGALYETFPPQEARRLLRRLEFHRIQLFCIGFADGRSF